MTGSSRATARDGRFRVVRHNRITVRRRKRMAFSQAFIRSSFFCVHTACNMCSGYMKVSPQTPSTFRIPAAALIDYFQSVSGKIDIHLVAGAVLHMPDGVGLQHELPEFHPERCLQIAIGMAGMILFIQLLTVMPFREKSRRIIGQ